ncbi:hypothetical protein J7359_19490 [Paracoccus sp. R12_2]|uniref:hypothetical protein n=1 Tax=Paracoccus sp. R12_2 TaxID=2821098 RepID=UPI001ADB9FC8|nr:hypothetical protein [Paracoccus sp. R12_2]MBO9457386.1 hypothetical protein [Paracoccus sp. R12_2]
MAHNKVTIKGDSAHALTEALIKKPAETYAELGKSIGMIRPRDITIERDGSITIDDPDFVKELETRSASVSPEVGFFDTNCSCNPK